jgi:hypothetical protein
MNSSARFCPTIVLTAALVFCASTETRACACCSDEGTHSLQPNEPLSGYVLEQIRGMEFASAAQLFLVDGTEPEEQIKGLANISESYVLSAAAEAKQWRVKLRTADGKSGELILSLPSKVAKFMVDIHNGETNAAGESLLYKEWRLEGRATGNEMFKEGFAAPARYTLIFQGRGNRCDNADDFTHWRLEISGKKAAYAFFGELASARPEHAEQRKLVHDALVRPDPSSTEDEKK